MITPSPSPDGETSADDAKRSGVAQTPKSRTLLVVDNPSHWSLDVQAEVVGARQYLTDASFSDLRRAKVYNLCRSYRYQTLGYYVSLLAAARGHRPLPAVGTLQGLRQRSLIRIAAEDLDDRIQRTLKPIKSAKFNLSIYFGTNMAERHRGLARALFNLFPCPVLRAQFERDEEGRWSLNSLRPLAAKDIPLTHLVFVGEAAHAYFAGKHQGGRGRSRARYDLAILVREDDPEPPSDRGAIRKFVRVAAELGIAAETIDKHDYGRLGEYDALFIRETTNVNHHTYRFALKAEAEGLVVMDNPQSIVRCSNKVFLEEICERLGIPRPRTLILHPGNIEQAEKELGLPLVLKKPDSAFSAGVHKVATRAELHAACAKLFEESELVIAQEFVPTDYDWRIGVLDRQALYACRYHMAKGHWQIINNARKGENRYGNFDAVPLAEVPPRLLKTAVRAANVMGDGLYGVDLKQVGKRYSIVEVNDNPSLDSGVEDKLLGDELYRRILQVFLTRIEARGKRRTRP